MTTSSITQYLEQKRVVRPVDWSAARREGVEAARRRRPRIACQVFERSRAHLGWGEFRGG